MRQIAVSRRGAIAALVVPALVLVAFAARSYQPFAGEAGDRRPTSTTFLDGAFTVMLVLGGLAALVVVWVWLHALRKRPRGRGSQAPYASFAVVFLVIIVTAVVAYKAPSERRLPWATGRRRRFAVSPAGVPGAACAPTGARSRSAAHLATGDRARLSHRGRHRGCHHRRAPPRPSRAPHSPSSWRSSAGRSTRRSTTSAVIPTRGGR